MTIAYLWAKLVKKLQLAAVSNCVLESPCKINAQSTAVNTAMGRYSYCGYGCMLNNCEIGRFCSIADNVTVGLTNHPLDWVSTSTAFYVCEGNQSIPNDMASLRYDAAPPKTVIGNDVWIGKNAILKAGITVGNGAMIGMGSVVTKDVPPYAIVAGNPARVIRMRFPQELADRLQASRWWELEPEKIKKYVPLMDRPEEFLAALEGEA